MYVQVISAEATVTAKALFAPTAQSALSSHTTRQWNIRGAPLEQGRPLSLPPSVSVQIMI